MLDLFQFGDAGWGDELVKGLIVTVQLALVTLPFGLLIGFGGAAMSLARHRLIRSVGFSYTTIMRGLPEILTLFLIYNGVGLAINKASLFLNPNASPIEFSPFVAGVVSLSLVFGAFASEVLRGAFQSLDEGQAEAGKAIGMTPIQIFIRIKVPQIWRFALPGLGNLWVTLLKDTSLVSIIALNDLMRMAKLATGITKLPFTFYFAACLAYWAISLLSELVLDRMERRANRGIRRAI